MASDIPVLQADGCSCTSGSWKDSDWFGFCCFLFASERGSSAKCSDHEQLEATVELCEEGWTAGMCREVPLQRHVMAEHDHAALVSGHHR